MAFSGVAAGIIGSGVGAIAFCLLYEHYMFPKENSNRLLFMNEGIIVFAWPWYAGN